MEFGGEEYKIVRRWIASGMPYGSPSDPTVTQDHDLPRTARHRPQGPSQQLAVYAHYSDGSVEDVTRRAQFESNDTDIATVERDRHRARRSPSTGQAAVMARFSGR